MTPPLTPPRSIRSPSRVPSLRALSLAVGLTVLTAAPAYADGMRCGTRLVSDGDSTYEVRERCGAPETSRQRVELRTVRQYVDGPCFQERGVVRCGHVIERIVEVLIDEWTYDFGPQQFIRHLTFEQGRLLHVETGGYGTVERG